MLVESVPCYSRCPVCKRACFGAEGHGRIATAGKGHATPHHCAIHGVWASNAEWVEIMRSEDRATRKECAEAVKGCGRCAAAIERLG